MNYLKILFLSMIFLFPSISSAGDCIAGRVVSVADGDTITILTSENKQVKIRFAGIDTPEKKQEFGQKAKEFDKKFEAGEDMTDDLDFSKARRVNQEPKRVNIDFPAWVVEKLDKQSKRLGITRQALVKVWIAEKLKEAV